MAKNHLSDTERLWLSAEIYRLKEGRNVIHEHAVPRKVLSLIQNELASLP